MLVGQNNWGMQGGMFVSQTAWVGRVVCWSVKTARVGKGVRFVDRLGRVVCWSVKPAGVGRYVCQSNSWGRYVGQSNQLGR